MLESGWGEREREREERERADHDAALCMQLMAKLHERVPEEDQQRLMGWCKGALKDHPPTLSVPDLGNNVMVYCILYVYIHTYVHACMHACIHIHTHTHTQTHTYSYIYIYIHTHTHKHTQGLCEQHLRDSESGLEIECDLRDLFAELLEIPLDSFNEQTGMCVCINM